MGFHKNNAFKLLPMKKKLAIYIVAIIIALTSFIVWYYFFNNEVILKNKITIAIAEGSEINMQKITPFAWDKFYVFQPYTSEKYINETLGFESSLKGPDYDELQLLVFVKENKIISSINYPRYSPGGDFLPENSYLPNEAIFINKNNILIKK